MAVVSVKKVLICDLKKDRKGTSELLQCQGIPETDNVLQEDDVFQRMDVASSKTVFERNTAVAEQMVMVPNKHASKDKGMLSLSADRELPSAEEYKANAVNHGKTMEKAYRLQGLAKQIGEHSTTTPKLKQQMEALAL